MPRLTNIAARSILYLLCIGGLLAFNTGVVMVIWNIGLPALFDFHAHLAWLEATGLVAIAYVFISAIRFSLTTGRRITLWPSHAERVSDVASEVTINPDQLGHDLSSEERLRLQQLLRDQHGCRKREHRA